MYLKTENSKIDSSYDTYFQKIDTKDITWKSILELIEAELEAQFLANEPEGIEGIKFSIEITSTLPDDIEMSDEY